MNKTDLPYWLQGLTLRFREENEDDDLNDNDRDDNENDDDPDNDDPDQGGDNGPDDEDDPEKRITALEEALANERKVRRKIERENKRLARKKAADRKEGDDAELQQQLQASEERTQRLAAGLLKKEIEAAVRAEARRQNFIDETDALIDDVLSEIDAEQDEEDPTDIDIDQDSVADAVKALARRKKHLVGQGTPSTPSGGKFRKKGGGDEGKLSEQALMDRYPGLRV